MVQAKKVSPNSTGKYRLLFYCSLLLNVVLLVAVLKLAVDIHTDTLSALKASPGATSQMGSDSEPAEALEKPDSSPDMYYWIYAADQVACYTENTGIIIKEDYEECISHLASYPDQLSLIRRLTSLKETARLKTRKEQAEWSGRDPGWICPKIPADSTELVEECMNDAPWLQHSNITVHEEVGAPCISAVTVIDKNKYQRAFVERLCENSARLLSATFLDEAPAPAHPFGRLYYTYDLLFTVLDKEGEPLYHGLLKRGDTAFTWTEDAAATG